MKIETFAKNENGDCYRTLEEYRFASFRGCPGFTVPAGFEFDGASVPALFQLGTFTPGDPRILYAALGHDYLYRAHPDGWTRRMADKFFYYYARLGGIRWWRAQKAYWGLRLFGWIAWRGNKK